MPSFFSADITITLIQPYSSLVVLYQVRPSVHNDKETLLMKSKISMVFCTIILR